MIQYDATSPAHQASGTGPLEFVHLSVESIDPAGRAVCMESFKADDFDLALARFIELHAEDELPPERRRGRYVLTGKSRDQHGSWSQRLVWSHDDQVFVDHRWGGVESQRPGEASWDEMTDAWRFRVTEVFAFTDRLTVIESVGEGCDREGGRVEISMVTVNDVGEDGVVHRCEAYRPDQIEEALARFDDLVAGAMEPHP
jgi:hypothetical protein